MVVQYTLTERKDWCAVADITILNITDRNQVLVTTNFGSVFTGREDAARILREFRHRRDNPFMWEGKQAQFVTVKKKVTT